MYLFSNYQITKSNYFSLLISLLPISFIAGNMIININVVLTIISALIIFRKKLFQINFYTLDKLLVSFFFLILFTGIYNDFKLSKFHEVFYSTREFGSTIRSLLFKNIFFYILLSVFSSKKYKLKFIFYNKFNVFNFCLP